MSPAKKTSPATRSTPPEVAPDDPGGGHGITLSEQAASERFGVSMEAIHRIRASYLEPGQDFVRAAGFVRITGAGMERMSELLGDAARGSEMASEPIVAALIVERANFTNPKIVTAKAPFSDVVVSVRVRDSAKWMRGMLMERCRQVNATLYHYEGRQPRQRGVM